MEHRYQVAEPALLERRRNFASTDDLCDDSDDVHRRERSRNKIKKPEFRRPKGPPLDLDVPRDLNIEQGISRQRPSAQNFMDGKVPSTDREVSTARESGRNVRSGRAGESSLDTAPQDVCVEREASSWWCHGLLVEHSIRS
jgi:hypothetical protein